MATVTSQLFRDAFGCWATGVSVVTTRLGEEIQGMTASSLTSVSLEPPLLLFCADLASETNALLERSRVFCVHLLGADQQALSNRFAARSPGLEKFAGLPWHEGATGAPRLDGVVATLDCRVAQRHEAGDHLIWVGEVVDVSVNPAAPLLYWSGGYRALRED